jgi:hypothetical protein
MISRNSVIAALNTTAGLPDRTCGSCTACCVQLDIDTPDLRKPEKVACPHLASCGCGIYETRPPVCRTWHCLWRRISALPDSVRPDRCNVLFSVQRMEANPLGPWIIQVEAMNSLDDFQQPDVQLALKRLIVARLMPIWVTHNGQGLQLFPEEDLTDAILNPETTEHRNLMPLADLLRREWQVTQSATSAPAPQQP